MGVDTLVDVRARAWSQRPEYRKTALRQCLEGAGLSYLHLKKAGNPFRPRKGETKDFATCAEEYKRHLANNPQILEEGLDLVAEREVAFFCYEAASSECHRSVLVKEMQRLQPDLEIQHL